MSTTTEAAKAADKLLAENWQINLIALYQMIALLEQMPIDAMIDKAETAQAIGPLLDPTMYRKKGDAAAQDLELLQAAQVFRDTWRANKARWEGRRPT